MAKDKLTEYDATAANNTVVGDVNLAENSALPSDMNNAVRELMSHLKNFSDGTDAIDALTSDGNILVGTTDTVPSNNGASGDAGVAISPDGVFRAARSGNVSLDINRMDSDGDIAAFRKDGSTVGSIATKSDDLNIFSSTSNHTGLRFALNAVLPTNNAGNVVDNQVDLGKASANYRFKDLYLSGGAYIGGTGAANYLDDVEEGTFTAVLNGGSGHPSTRVNTTGYYTKVNTMVFISINFENISTASYSGSISVFGLPFACGNGAARQVFTIAFYETASFSGTGGSFGHLSATGTEIYLLNNRSGNSWENLTHAAGSGRYLAITGTYSAA